MKRMFAKCAASKPIYSIAVRDSTGELFRLSKANVRVHRDTGFLEKSGYMKIDNDVGTVGYNAHYGPHLEFGHRLIGGGYYEGVRYLGRAIDVVSPRHFIRLQGVTLGLLTGKDVLQL